MSLAEQAAAPGPSLTLKRRLNAPAEKVYAAWTAVVKPVVEQLWAEANAEGQ